MWRPVQHQELIFGYTGLGLRNCVGDATIKDTTFGKQGYFSVEQG